MKRLRPREIPTAEIATSLVHHLSTKGHRAHGSSVEMLRELSARLPRAETAPRRMLAMAIRESRRRRRAGDRAFSDALTRALVVASWIALTEMKERAVSQSSALRLAVDEVSASQLTRFDKEIWPDLERGLYAKAKQRGLSAAAAAAKRKRADQNRQKVLRGETVHLSERQKRRLRTGK